MNAELNRTLRTLTYCVKIIQDRKFRYPAKDVCTAIKILSWADHLAGIK